jgi:hypothetical protein
VKLSEKAHLESSLKIMELATKKSEELYNIMEQGKIEHKSMMTSIGRGMRKKIEKQRLFELKEVSENLKLPDIVKE